MMLFVFRAVSAIVLLAVTVFAAAADEDATRARGKELMALYKAGQFKEAAIAAEAYTSALEKAFGVGAAGTTQGYVAQAKCHALAGDNSKAQAAQEKALQLVATEYAEDPEAAALYLITLASASFELQDFAEAADLAVQGTSILHQGDYECPQELPDILVTFARHAHDAGRFTQEQSCLDSALSATAKVYGEPSPQHTDLLELVALARTARQRYSEGAALWEKTISARAKSNGEDDRDLADCYQGAATCWELAGDYAKAEAVGRQALECVTKQTDPKSADTVEILAILARACAQQAKWEEAESLAKQSLAIVEDKYGLLSKEANECRQTMALVYAMQERFDEAEALIRQSLTASEQDGNDRDEVLLYSSSLASLLWNAGKHGEAERVFRETIAAAEKAWGSNDVALALLTGNLAANCFYLGKHEQAEKLTRQSLDTLRTRLGEEHPRVAILFINLATTEAAQGKWAEAAETNDIGCRGMARQIRGQLASLAAVEQLRLLRGQYAIGYQAALTMGMLQRSNPRIRVFSAGWLANGKAIAHEAAAQQLPMASRRDGDDEQTGPGLWVDVDTIRAQIPPSAVFIDFARFAVFNYAARRKGEDWKPARYAAWITPPQGQGSVQVVDLGEASAIDAAVSAYREALRQAIGEQSLAAKLGEAHAEKMLSEAARPLVDSVLQPIMAGVKAAGCEKSATELILSPDGELWLVPWAALPLEDGRYLVEQYATATVTSGRDLIPPRERAKPGKSLIFADPLFDLPGPDLVRAVKSIDASDELSYSPSDTSIASAVTCRFRSVSEIRPVEPLPASVSEARRVAKRIEEIFDETPKVFLKGRALEERVKRARSPRILHFATHGFVLADQVTSVSRIEQQSVFSKPGKPIQGLTSEAGEPLEDPLLRCGLLFAGCNAAATERPEGVEDGCLTGKEIAALDLRGTELVVLSACDTGLGRVQYGEGVAGLRQAFLIAGAESVLASLWQVPDLETADFMSRFYANLASDRDCARALQRAQLEVLKRRRKAFGAANPAVWAGFHVTGR